MLGVLVNVATILVGGLIGTLLKKGIPEAISRAVMVAIGGCVLYIGIAGMLKGEQVLCTILAMVSGTLVGSWLDLDAALTRLGDAVETKLAKKSDSIGQGFVAGTLLFCIGSMAVIGSLSAGISGDNQTLFAKSLLDLISAAMLATTLGWGVCLSAISVGIYQGLIVLFSGFLAPLLSDVMIAEITCTGSILIVFLALNLMGLSRFKIANFLPAILFTPFIVQLVLWLSALLA